MKLNKAQHLLIDIALSIAVILLGTVIFINLIQGYVQ